MMAERAEIRWRERVQDFVVVCDVMKVLILRIAF